jgi:hypothetical protein
MPSPCNVLLLSLALLACWGTHGKEEVGPRAVTASEVDDLVAYSSDADTEGQDSSRELLGNRTRGVSKVSVVMLNWQRPGNVQKIASKYVEYTEVLEVIIWMCHPETRYGLHGLYGLHATCHRQTKYAPYAIHGPRGMAWHGMASYAALEARHAWACDWAEAALGALLPAMPHSQRLCKRAARLHPYTTTAPSD